MTLTARDREGGEEPHGQPDPGARELETGSPARPARPAWAAVAKGALAHSKHDRLSVIAGSLAYRWFLSIFPVLILLLGIAALAHVPSNVVNKLVHGASTTLPPGAAGVIAGAIKSATSRTSGAVPAVAVAAVVALWSALSGMTVLQSGLNMAYDIAADRKFLPKRLVGLGLMAAAGVLGGGASALVVFGPQLGRALDGAVPVAGTAFVVVWTVVRWVAAILLVVVLMSVIYWAGPARARPRWQWISAGAVVATLVWVAASLGVSYYTTSFGSYGKTYGAFAGVAILIFWLYVTGAVVLLGAEINAELEREQAAKPGRPDLA